MAADNEVVIWTNKDIDIFSQRLKDSIYQDEPLKISWKNYKVTRSLSANRLYWMWMDTLAGRFSEKGKKVYDRAEIHNICKHKFLGYEDIRINNTVIPNQLKDSKSLDKGEFFFYMRQVDDWAMELEIYLERPEKGEYNDMVKDQAGGS